LKTFVAFVGFLPSARACRKLFLSLFDLAITAFLAIRNLLEIKHYLENGNPSPSNNAFQASFDFAVVFTVICKP